MRIGLIAGNGAFPFLVLDAARRLGHQVTIIAVQEEASPDLDAAVMYYGHPELDPMALEKLKAPLLGIFGAKDKSIPPEMVKKFDEALTTAKKEHVILSYDAEHAFANPSNPKYDEENAAKAWTEVQKFLAEHLKAPAEKKAESK